MALYNTCKRMIERGKTAGMAKKLDIFYAANKLTDEQYAELTEMLAEKTSACPGRKRTHQGGVFMIEFPITLTSGGSVCLPGYASALALGYTKNKSVYHLAVSATGEWEGLTIRAFWHVPGGSDPASTLVVDGYVAVPASVTAQPGNGCITFEGSDGTRTVTSADLRYRVSANSGTEDGTMPEPGTPAWQELVDAVHTDATAAEQAKTDAQTAAQQAGASAQKAGKALSDTITAKEDALKAIGDKQTTATQAVDIARDKALQQVEASTEAAQTAASEAATSAGNADQSAQEAAGSLQELKDGIANGNFKGEPGNDGKSPVVTVTDIENGHRISITDKDGTKTIDVLNGQAGKDGTQIDDATVGLDAWSSKHIIDTLCPPISETGNPVVCYPVEGSKLGVKASWEPTQEGSGDPSPDNIRPISGRDSVTVTRCGGNLLPFSKQSFKFTQYLGPYAVNLKAGTYYLSCGNVAHDGKENPVIAFTDEKLIIYYFLTKKSGQIVKLNRDCHIIYLYANHYDFNGSAGITATIEDLMLVPGTTAPTTYAPYTGQTATLTLPRTIYGGTVDAVTGEGLGMWKLLTLDGTEPWNAVGSGDTLYFQSTSISIGTRVLSRGDYCTTFPIASVSSSNTVQGVSGWKTSLYLRWSTFADVAALKSYLAAQYAAGTPVQVCYKLATPTPFTATGARPVPALSSANTVLTDADSVVVTGRADPIKRITDLEDAVASMTTN